MNTLIKDFDLTLAWKWDLDADFVQRIDSVAQAAGVSLVQVTTANLDEVTGRFSSRTMSTRWFYDRASDEDDRFIPLAETLERQSLASASEGPFIINHRLKAQHASDKATMHLELLAAGIRVPNTIIVPPFATQPAFFFPDGELHTLGTTFVIKPANTTGGGTGVVLGAKTWADVDQARKALPSDKFLLQEILKPVYLGDFRAWFRVYYAFGSTILCWWDDRTHLYESVAPDDEAWFGLGVLRDAVQKIQAICGLDFFSTEFCQSSAGDFIAVDYVNEICDMRPQSKALNGVPDAVVDRVATQLIESVRAKAAVNASP